LKSVSALFDPSTQNISTTSAIMFPALHAGRDLSGIRPNQRVAIFDDIVRSQLLPRLAAAPNALIIPLGVSVERLLEQICSLADTSTSISRNRILTGLPHPSGQYVQRHERFAENRASIERQIRAFFA
jgi:hypothetical protein